MEGVIQALREWAPTRETIIQDLTFVPTGNMEEKYFVGVPIEFDHNGISFYADGRLWSATCAVHWEFPVVAVILYFVMIPTMKHVVGKYGKWDWKQLTMCWNAFLSMFSWCGVVCCVPVLLDNFARKGLFFTTCAPAHWYGTGFCGLFVALFIFSKFAELFDTFLLLVAKKPVIALQWWHHSTVLLYCWHSYAARIGTGLWFAAMNYVVHAFMYGYFALTATRYRKYVQPYAIFITLGQLMQMIVGMFVTIKAVQYQIAGIECNVNKTNSILGLAMYFSYFVLFFILFVENYCCKRKRTDIPSQCAVTTPGEIKGKLVEDSANPDKLLENGFHNGAHVNVVDESYTNGYDKKEK
uniref:Elongation of fatty acids protein n=1 Tax=Noctiluca scintillans TaxID=2966 RepID=A0A7S0ZUN4_NOCSC